MIEKLSENEDIYKSSREKINIDTKICIENVKISG